MRLNNKSIVTSAMGWLLCIMPIVETLNGMYMGHHISDLYRILTIGFVIIFLFGYQDIIFAQTFEMIAVIAFLGILVIMQFIFIYSYRGPLVSDLKSLTRIFIAFIYFAYFYKTIQLKILNQTDFKKYIRILIALYIVCMMIPFVLGKGLATYDIHGSGMLAASQGIGFKGYFVEINSLTALFIGFMVFTGEEFLSNLEMNVFKQACLDSGLFLGIFTCLLLTTTKTGIAFGIGYFVVVIIRLLVHRQINVQLKLSVATMIGLIIAVLSTQCLSQLLISMNGLLNRGLFFYKQMNGNWISFLTSNRSQALENNVHQMLNSNHFLFIHFFGAGYFVNMQSVMESRKITEMDIFDLYFSYGLLGLSAYIGYFRASLLQFWSNKKDSVAWMLIMMFIYSLFGGHVFVNAMTSTIIAIIMAYFIADQKEEKA